MTLKHVGLFLPLISFFLLLASCKDNPAEQYGTTLVQSLKSAKRIDAAVNVQDVRKSIQEFYAANGRYPADLGEVQNFNGMVLKSDKYDYDPATGTLTERR